MKKKNKKKELSVKNKVPKKRKQKTKKVLKKTQKKISLKTKKSIVSDAMTQINDVIVTSPTPISNAAKLKHIKRPTSTSEVRNYLSKKELLSAVLESKKLGKMSDDLAFKLQLLTNKYAKSAQYARYTFRDDMEAYALFMLVRTWGSFNPEKSDNPFAFYTQCIKNSFIQYLNQEKRQRNIKDELSIDQGLAPSYSYQLDYEQQNTHTPSTSDEEKMLVAAHHVEQTDHDDSGEE